MQRSIGLKAETLGLGCGTRAFCRFEPCACHNTDRCPARQSLLRISACLRQHAKNQIPIFDGAPDQTADILIRGDLIRVRWTYLPLLPGCGYSYAFQRCRLIYPLIELDEEQRIPAVSLILTLRIVPRYLRRRRHEAPLASGRESAASHRFCSRWHFYRVARCHGEAAVRLKDHCLRSEPPPVARWLGRELHRNSRRGKLLRGYRDHRLREGHTQLWSNGYLPLRREADYLQRA